MPACQSYIILHSTLPTACSHCYNLALAYIIFHLRGGVKNIQRGYVVFIFMILGVFILFLVFLGGVQTIFKVFRGGQGLFTDSREGLEKIEKKVQK